jgi:methylenetetrahydrofolate dehydrogenase (NADP+)/methenyltetrahydrofolate cyclohydrolase
MKILNGAELADYIKVRHAQQVRSLKAAKTLPKLAIVQVKDDPVINTYVRLKQKYGADIGALVDVHKIEQSQVAELLNKLSIDKLTHGIIVQLPLSETSQTDELLNLVPPAKDVDGLGKRPMFDPATPMAILWLLSGYNIELRDKKILLVGHGKLVGTPLSRMLIKSQLDVSVADANTRDLAAKTKEADIIISATGVPGLIRSDMISRGAVVVDAGVAGEDGKTAGDLADDVYERDDLTLTPKKGGVGPLTVCALFENLIRAAQNTTKS